MVEATKSDTKDNIPEISVSGIALSSTIEAETTKIAPSPLPGPSSLASALSSSSAAHVFARLVRRPVSSLAPYLVRLVNQPDLL